MQKLDILVMAVHPDDAELGCSGTIAAQVAQGNSVGILEFTRGELGTRGSAEIRMQEAAESSKILQLSARENLGFRDGFFLNDEAHQLKVIAVIRKYQPEIVLINAPDDRHPDHPRANKLAVESCFYSGLRRISTQDADGNEQAPWRPKKVYQYIQDNHIEPDFVVDISDYWDVKEASMRAFTSQFYIDEKSKEGPQSYISRPGFLEFIEARAKIMGHRIGVKYGEGFIAKQEIGVKSLFDLMT